MRSLIRALGTHCLLPVVDEPLDYMRMRAVRAVRGQKEKEKQTEAKQYILKFSDKLEINSTFYLLYGNGREFWKRNANDL